MFLIKVKERTVDVYRQVAGWRSKNHNQSWSEGVFLDLNGSSVCDQMCLCVDSHGTTSQTIERWIRNHPLILSSFAFVLPCRRGLSYPRGTVESLEIIVCRRS